MSQFTEILVVSPLADGRTWVIRGRFGYDVGAEGSGDYIGVPIGFKTDFASVPRVFWWIFPQWGKYGNAAVVHDFLYWEQKRSRKECDGIFLEAMGVLNVAYWQRMTIFWMVRVFGFLAWASNTRKHRRHVKRVVDKMPLKSIEMP